MSKEENKYTEMTKKDIFNCDAGAASPSEYIEAHNDSNGINNYKERKVNHSLGEVKTLLIDEIHRSIVNKNANMLPILADVLCKIQTIK
ncbi:MAG: hypothetical protein L3I99_01885 [Sulfurimonas sp.]|nr:hypothetical protein [Sulfurimonas sp.]